MTLKGVFKILLNMQPCRMRNTAKTTISTVTKNASCSHGWLRLVVQCIFGAITIASFTLIVYMSMVTGDSQQRSSRCRLYTCRVQCINVPFYDLNVDDLLNAVREAEVNCNQITLSLNEPAFINATLPSYWLSSLRSNVVELQIIRCNLNYIEPNAFMTQFAANIRRLYFESIAIMGWTPESFIGLTNLKEISITKSHILKVQNNVLKAVDDTLETLSITESGYWNPTNLTGQTNMEKLTSVHFSNNNFNNILDKESLKGLKRCKVLYLNSCRISALGAGTFDHLDEIEMLYLNDNFLMIVPHGIFSKMLTMTNPQPRINLQNNLWYCDCSNSELHTLTTSGLLVLEPTCYYPTLIKTLTFSDFFARCNNNSTDRVTREYNIAGSSVSHLNTIILNEDGTSNRIVSILVSSISIMACSSIQFQDIRLSNLHKLETSNFKNKSNMNELLQVRFALKSDSLSMIEITSTSSASGNYGLLWYPTIYPDDLYCVNILPTYLRVFNTESDMEYTFCPIQLQTGSVASEMCIHSDLQTKTETTIAKSLRILSYLLTTIVCTVVGASIVYTVIRKFPNLLKGSDRILFVKHKNVEALVLPPKLPLREKLSKDNEADENIFTLTDNRVPCNNFIRTKSTRSNKSVAPSYISAMQPTEEQLTEWRLRQHFNNDVMITTTGFNHVPYSVFTDNESMCCSLEQASSNTYESLK